MGYFNFIYKLSRILSNKKLLKAFIFIVLVCLLIFSLSNTSQAVSSYNEEYADPYNAFTTNYGAIQRDFILRFANSISNGDISSAQLQAIKNFITSGDYVVHFYYNSLGEYDNSSPLNKNVLKVNFYAWDSISSPTTTNYDWFGIRGITNYRINLSQSYVQVRYDGDTYSYRTFSDSSVTLPYAYLNYFDEVTTSYFNNIVSDDGSVNTVLNNMLIQMGYISANTEDTSEELGEIKDFIKDKNASDSSYNQNSTTVNDNYSSSVNDLYSDIVEAFGVDGGFAQSIILPIPFTDETITIPSTLVSSRVSGTFIETIVTLFWWYIIGSFILKDILKYIDKLKSGDVISGSDTNIKADML